MWMRRTLGPFSRKCFLPGCGEDSRVCNIYWGGTAGGTLCRQQPAREEKYHVRCEVPPEVNPSRRRTGKPTTNSPFRSWKLQTGRGEVSVEHDTAARLTRPSCNLHETDRKLGDNMEAA